MKTISLLVCLIIPVLQAHLPEHLNEDSPDEAHIGRVINCTAEEKRCYQFGRIPTFGSKKCYVVGSRANCASALYLNKKVALEKSNYVGKCVPEGECAPNEVKTKNGTCVEISEYCENGKKMKFNLFGEPTCLCENCTSPLIEIRQPEEEGVCRVPDFRAAKMPALHTVRKNFPCSTEEFYCLNKSSVLWPGDGKCYDLLQKGPCQNGEWLVLDEEEYINGTGRLNPICFVQPCPEGELLMQFDGKCYTKEEVGDVFCTESQMVTNVFGKSGCEYYESIFSSDSSRENMCKWEIKLVLLSRISGKVCSESDDNKCPPPVEFTADYPDL